jgi:3-dehydroquinate dehydratase
MTALSIQPAYPIFTDTAGQPLDNGYIWIGTVNLAPQTNPISIYWDAALTQTAAQPLRTSGGYIVNSGTPAVIYADSDYSILVQNAKGSAVYSSLAATDRFSGVVVKVDASDVDYTSPGTGAVTTTVQEYLQQVVNVTDFGADSTGVLDATSAITAAITYAKTLTSPQLIINAGTYTTSSVLTFDLPEFSTITFIGSIVSSVSNDPAIRIGSTTANIAGITATGIKVERLSLDTAGASSGVQLRNLTSSYIDIRRCSGFRDGIFCYGDQANGGFSYNEIHIGFVHDNRRNIYLNAGSVGYCNENNFYGGTFNHSSTYPAVTTTNLEIAHFASSQLNNNRFYGPSFEDNSATLATAAIINGNNNVIYWPRMENPGDQTGYEIQFTADSGECRILGHGFTMVNSNINDLGDGNMYETREGAVMRYQTPATAGKAVLKLQSYGTSAATVLSVLDSGGVETAKITGVGEAKFTGTTRALAIYNTSGFETAYVTGAGDAVFNSVNTSIPSPTGNFVLVTASSKVLVGVASSAGAQGLQVYGLASTGAQNILQRAFSDTTTGANLLLLKTRGTTATSTTAVQSGDTLGSVVFLGSDGTSNQAFGAITGFVDGAVSAGTVPTAVSITAGTTSGTERMRITSAGLMGIGTGTPASSAIVDVTSTTLGFKFPVMTTTQKNAIVSPVAGLVIFDSTLAKLCVYSGAAWQTITSV